MRNNEYKRASFIELLKDMKWLLRLPFYKRGLCYSEYQRISYILENSSLPIETVIHDRIFHLESVVGGEPFRYKRREIKFRIECNEKLLRWYTTNILSP